MDLSFFKNKISSTIQKLSEQNPVKKSQIKTTKDQINRFIDLVWKTFIVDESIQGKLDDFHWTMRSPDLRIDNSAALYKKLIKFAKSDSVEFVGTEKEGVIKELCDFLVEVKGQMKDLQTEVQKALDEKNKERDANEADPYRKFYTARREDVIALKEGLEQHVKPLQDQLRGVYVKHYYNVVERFNKLDDASKRSGRTIRTADPFLCSYVGRLFKAASYGGQYELADNLQDVIDKQIDEHVKGAIEQFVYKQVSKIAPLLKEDKLKDLEVSAQVNSSGTLDSHLHVQLESDTKFTAYTQLVSAYMHGKWVDRYPTIFQNVITPDGFSGKKLSEAEMHELVNKDTSKESGLSR